MPQLQEDREDFLFQQDGALPYFQFDIHATVPQSLEILEGLMNYPVVYCPQIRNFMYFSTAELVTKFYSWEVGGWY
jgi:hypothetical protein